MKNHIDLIIRGYGKLLRGGALLGGALLALTGGVMLLITPLWYLATQHRALYNLLFLGIAAALTLVFFLVAPLMKAHRQKRSMAALFKKKALSLFKALARLIPLLLFFYGILLSLSAGLWPVSLLLTLLGLYVGGYLLFAKKASTPR